MSVPSLVGGIATRDDLPGAIVFAAAYGLLVPIFVYRLFDERWRSIIFIQALAFTIERPVMFSLRASAAANPNTESSGVTKYMQATFALAFLALAQNVLRLLRVMLINTTTATPSDVDEPRRRFWYRRWTDFLMVLQLVAMIPGIVATASLPPASDSSSNHTHWVLRYVSSALGLVFILLEILTLLWASKALPRIDQRAVRLLLVMTTLLTISPIYRLVVMHHTTPDIHAPGHQALNTKADKVAFYIVHLLPEFIVAFLFCAFNVKDICNTGFMGDGRWWDETPKERERRERKEQEKKSSSEQSEDP